MELRNLLTLMSVWGLSVSASASSYAASAASGQQYDPKTLAQVEALYGLSEDAAVSRLAREYEAAVQARRIEERHLPSYAGTWFDSVTQSLRVAANSKSDFSVIEGVGATPVLVEHSLKELETTRNDIANALASELGQGSVRESYVDIQANAIVVGVSEGAMERASAFMATRAHVSVPVQLTAAANDVGFSTNLLGADGTQNLTWHNLKGGVWPCSVGASAEEVIGASYVAGFATAGHCGWATNVFQSSSGTNLGTVNWSSYNSNGTFTNHEDGAWVGTYTGWAPQPQVNGYTDGTLNVSGTWAGTLDAPVGTTACRYGASSGGPHCASITQRNVSVTIGVVRIDGLIKVNAICTNDGDSGGPLITPSNQVQGTVSSGTSNSCPDSSGDVVYFYPITTTLSLATSALSNNPVAMLTSHGRSAPTMPAFVCPDPANSGEHIYECTIPSFDSQGLTNISWTSNTGAHSTTTNLSGTCTTGQVVTVALAVSNPYGTTNRNYSFTCPINPLP